MSGDVAQTDAYSQARQTAALPKSWHPLSSWSACDSQLVQVLDEGAHRPAPALERRRASGAGRAADEARDVDRRPRHSELQRLVPAHVAPPTLYAGLLLRKPLVEAACPFRDHRLLGRGQRARLVSEARDGGLVAV